MTLAEVSQSNVRAGMVASVSEDGTAAVITFRGEADLFTLPVIVDVLARVIADHDGAIVVDLGHTEFIDTTVVRALARAWQFLDDRGRTLTLRSPSSAASRVIALLGLSRLIEPALRSNPSGLSTIA
ncbi:MAG: anti-sigma factor antagonist [Actinomycetota bacterium]|nr:anti-sigma factor antagonist [Actinomycetota bacterium]